MSIGKMAATVELSGFPQYVTLEDLARGLDKCLKSDRVGTFIIRDLSTDTPSQTRLVALDFKNDNDAVEAQRILDQYEYTLSNNRQYTLKAVLIRDSASPERIERNTSPEQPVYSNAVMIYNRQRAEVDKRHENIDEETMVLRKQLLILNKKAKVKKAAKKLKKTKKKSKKRSESESSGSDSDEVKKRKKKKKRRARSSSSSSSSSSTEPMKPGSSKRIRTSSGTSHSSTDRKRRHLEIAIPADRSMTRRKSPRPSWDHYSPPRSSGERRSRDARRSRHSPHGRYSPQGRRHSPHGRYSPQRRHSLHEHHQSQGRYSPQGRYSSQGRHSPQRRHSLHERHPSQGLHSQHERRRSSHGRREVQSSRRHSSPYDMRSSGGYPRDSEAVLVDRSNTRDAADRRCREQLEEGEVDEEGAYEEDIEERRSSSPEYRLRREEYFTGQVLESTMPSPWVEYIDPNKIKKEGEAKPKVVSPNPRFVLSTKKVMWQMRSIIKSVDEDRREYFEHILNIILRLRMKDMLEHNKDYVHWRVVLELYRELYPAEQDGALAAAIDTALKQGAFDPHRPDDHTRLENTKLPEDLTVFLPFISDKKKMDEDKENKAKNDEDVVVLEKKIDLVVLDAGAEDDIKLDAVDKTQVAQSTTATQQTCKEPEPVPVKIEPDLTLVKKEKDPVDEIPEIRVKEEKEPTNDVPEKEMKTEKDENISHSKPKRKSKSRDKEKSKKRKSVHRQIDLTIEKTKETVTVKSETTTEDVLVEVKKEIVADDDKETENITAGNDKATEENIIEKKE